MCSWSFKSCMTFATSWSCFCSVWPLLVIQSWLWTWRERPQPSAKMTSTHRSSTTISQVTLTQMRTSWTVCWISTCWDWVNSVLVITHRTVTPTWFGSTSYLLRSLPKSTFSMCSLPSSVTPTHASPNKKIATLYSKEQRFLLISSILCALTRWWTITAFCTLWSR